MIDRQHESLAWPKRNRKDEKRNSSFPYLSAPEFFALFSSTMGNLQIQQTLFAESRSTEGRA